MQNAYAHMLYQEIHYQIYSSCAKQENMNIMGVGVGGWDMVGGSGDGLLCMLRLNFLDLPSFATGSGHLDYPGQPGHIFPGSCGSDLLYKISGSDPDFA